MFLDLRFLLDFLLGWLARPTVKTPEPGVSRFRADRLRP